eukprot:GSMAST32.ASY1.ANO1.2118.1 assembled CDS
MKFRFCGGLDCPTWLLTEVVVLSKLSASHTQVLCNQIVAHLTGKEIDFKEVQKAAKKCDITGESNIKAALAALHFIFTNAVKHDVASNVLNVELQQLGLPQKNSSIVQTIYANGRDDVSETFRENSFKLPQLKKIDWRVDYILDSSVISGLNMPTVSMKFHLSHDMNTPYSKVDFRLENSKEDVRFHYSFQIDFFSISLLVSN